MRFFLLISSITLLSLSVNAQKLNKKFIKGTWKFNAIMLDSVYIIKLDNPEYSIHTLMKEMRKAKPGSGIEDSLMVMSKWKQTKEEMDLIYFVFNKDGSCVLSGKRKDGMIANEQKVAHYELDKENNEILISEGNERFSSFKVHLKKEIIYMEGELDKGKLMIMEFTRQ